MTMVFGWSELIVVLCMITILATLISVVILWVANHFEGE